MCIIFKVFETNRDCLWQTMGTGIQQKDPIRGHGENGTDTPVVPEHLILSCAELSTNSVMPS